MDGLTIGVNAQGGEQPQGDRRRIGIDLNLEEPQYRVAVERVAQRRDVAAATVDTDGFTVIGAFKHAPRTERRTTPVTSWRHATSTSTTMRSRWSRIRSRLAAPTS